MYSGVCGHTPVRGYFRHSKAAGTSHLHYLNFWWKLMEASAKASIASMQASTEAFIASMEAGEASMDASMDASVEASVEVTSMEVFRGSFHGSHFH